MHHNTHPHHRNIHPTPAGVLVSDYVFGNLASDNVVESLLAVHGLDFGEPGKLIEDASFAFLFRNAVDIGGAALARLPLQHHKKLLLSLDLYTLNEFQRYKLALSMKLGARAALLTEQASVAAKYMQCNCMLLTHVMQLHVAYALR